MKKSSRLRDTDESILTELSVAEQYALDLIADGAQARAESSKSSESALGVRQHETAVRLALSLVKLIREHGDVILRVLREPSRFVTDVPQETQVEVAVGALKRLADHTEMAGAGDVKDPEGIQRIFFARRILASLGYSHKRKEVKVTDDDD